MADEPEINKKVEILRALLRTKDQFDELIENIDPLPPAPSQPFKPRI